MIRRLTAFFSIFLFLASADPLFAAMSVSASVESGTYDRVFEVKLVPSDPDAKLFYTFEPDGSPMDAYAYTGAIRVAASTPLMYFAFTDPTNESPIYRQDYELRYSTGVLLSVSPADRIASLSRPATETGSIALDSWTLRKDERILHEFSETDFLPAWAAFSASFELPADMSGYGEYSLVAPDESVAASLSVSEPRPESVLPAIPSNSRPTVHRPSIAARPIEPAASVADSVPASPASGTVTAEPRESPTESVATPVSPSDTSPSQDVGLTLDDIVDAPTLQSETDPATPTASEASPDPQSSTVPDVSASARTFGGLLPLAFMFLVALAVSAWRVSRARVAAVAKKLR